MVESMSAQTPSIITTGLIVVTVIFPIISAVAIWLRIVARQKSRQPLYSDDYFIFASWFLSFALSILVWVYAAKSGIDYYKVDDLTGTESSLELIETSPLSLVFMSSVYIQWPLAAVKIGVLLFYKRLFTTPVFRTVVWCTIALVSVWCLLFFSLMLAQIDPLAFPLTQVRLRFDDVSFGLAQVATSFVLDLIVLCLPIPVISRLSMKRKRKLALGLIFWLGGFCTVASIVRTVLLNESIREVVSSDSYRRVANQSKQYIFLVAEPNISILAASTPTYGPLFAGGRIAESFFHSIRNFFRLCSGSGGSRSRDRAGPQEISSPPMPSDAKAYRQVGKSQVELALVEDWQGRGVREVNVSHSDPPPQVLPNHRNGISVTNGISVRTE